MQKTDGPLFNELDNIKLIEFDQLIKPPPAATGDHHETNRTMEHIHVPAQVQER